MWTSLSNPKQIISPVSVYYPTRVGSSPYDIIINNGPSTAAQCTATGEGLETATAGKLSYISI